MESKKIFVFFINR